MIDSSCFNSNNRSTNVDTPMMQTDKIVTNDRFLVSKSATICWQVFDATNTGLFRSDQMLNVVMNRTKTMKRHAQSVNKSASTGRILLFFFVS